MDVKKQHEKIIQAVMCWCCRVVQPHSHRLLANLKLSKRKVSLRLLKEVYFSVFLFSYC